MPYEPILAANQGKIHWLIEDLRMEYVYIKTGTPRLNGKVDCSTSQLNASSINCSNTKETEA